VVIINQRITELIFFIADIKNGNWRFNAFCHAKTLRHASGRIITHHHFQRNDVHFFHQLFSFINFPDEMRRNSFFVEVFENQCRYGIVHFTFKVHISFFLCIKGGCIIFKTDNYLVGIICFKNLLCLSFIKHCSFCHFYFLLDFIFFKF